MDELRSIGLAVEMTRRLSEKPIRIGFDITESAPNVFTTSPIELPAVPSISVIRGDAKALGVEIMDIMTEMADPDPEAGQNNTLTFQILKGPAPTVALLASDQRSIYRRRKRTRVVEVTAVGEVTVFTEEPIFADLTDHDGNGEIVLDDQIHALIQGGGNAGVKQCTGYLLVHLIEVDATEAVFEMIETAR